MDEIWDLIESFSDCFPTYSLLTVSSQLLLVLAVILEDIHALPERCLRSLYFPSALMIGRNTYVAKIKIVTKVCSKGSRNKKTAVFIWVFIIMCHSFYNIIHLFFCMFSLSTC